MYKSLRLLIHCTGMPFCEGSLQKQRQAGPGSSQPSWILVICLTSMVFQTFPTPMIEPWTVTGGKIQSLEWIRWEFWTKLFIPDIQLSTPPGKRQWWTWLCLCMRKIQKEKQTCSYCCGCRQCWCKDRSRSRSRWWRGSCASSSTPGSWSPPPQLTSGSGQRSRSQWQSSSARCRMCLDRTRSHRAGQDCRQTRRPQDQTPRSHTTQSTPWSSPLSQRAHTRRCCARPARRPASSSWQCWSHPRTLAALDRIPLRAWCTASRCTGSTQSWDGNIVIPETWFELKERKWPFSSVKNEEKNLV